MIQSLPPIHASPNLVDQVYHHLADAISDGQLNAGTRLTQEEVAEQLAVSRQPVLQALRLLKADGLVNDAPAARGHKGRGVVVAPICSQQVVQVYQVRAAIDSLAARLAARKQVRLDSALIERGLTAAQGPVIKDMVDADLAFHCAIYQASGNPLIEPSAKLHWCHIRRAMSVALRHAPLQLSAWDEHQSMLEAIAQGHENEVAQLMLTHGEQASRHLESLLQQHPPGVA